MQDLGRYTKKSHVEIHNRYVSLLIAGSVALVGLVFALGVLVGSRQARAKEVCPSADPLAVLDAKSSEPMPPTAFDRASLSFHETLISPVDSVPTPASLVERDEAGTKAEAPAPALEPVREEPAIPEEMAVNQPGLYSLQVGSFQDRKEAGEMARKLGKAGHRAFLVAVSMPDRGGMWYRVRVGTFNSKHEAWIYKKKFEDRERLPAFIVKRGNAKG